MNLSKKEIIRACEIIIEAITNGYLDNYTMKENRRKKERELVAVKHRIERYERSGISINDELKNEEIAKKMELIEAEEAENGAIILKDFIGRLKSFEIPKVNRKVLTKKIFDGYSLPERVGPNKAKRMMVQQFRSFEPSDKLELINEIIYNNNNLSFDICNNLITCNKIDNFEHKIEQLFNDNSFVMKAIKQVPRTQKGFYPSEVLKMYIVHLLNEDGVTDES
jgi:hypothetical protein